MKPTGNESPDDICYGNIENNIKINGCLMLCGTFQDARHGLDFGHDVIFDARFTHS